MILMGNTKDKRTLYFKKAAQHLDVSVQMLPYYDSNGFSNHAAMVLKEQKNKAVFCKIDPPTYDFMGEKQYQIDSMYETAKTYYHWLLSLPKPSEALCYLNTPNAIALLLDKYQCKKRLLNIGLSTTPLLGVDISCYQELQQLMKDRHCYAVFIKPRLASGAAGILAYRFQYKTGREQLYTSARFDPVKKTLINTKKLFCYRDKKEIQTLFSYILPLGTITERWIPKADYKHLCYDLRILYQFGKIAFITVRQSYGPITNLHLNNKPLESEQTGSIPKCLNLTKKQLYDLEQLCHQAVLAFDGLCMAGIDILFEKNSGHPYIIEMNGQGDLLYQDIYTENRIYKEQAAMALTIE